MQYLEWFFEHGNDSVRRFGYSLDKADNSSHHKDKPFCPFTHADYSLSFFGTNC